MSSPASPDEGPAIVLDRAERAAMRRELACCGNGWGDFEIHIEQGDRAAAQRALDNLGTLLRFMDAIGWQEVEDAPDHQPIDRAAATELAAWAADNANGLVGCLEQSDPTGAEDMDSDLLALSVMRRVAAAGPGGPPAVDAAVEEELDAASARRVTSALRREQAARDGRQIAQAWGRLADCVERDFPR